MAKKRVAIICGGKSSEHEISCVSAGGVLSAIDTNKFEVVLIGITKGGKWLLLPTDTTFTIINGALPQVPETGVEVQVSNNSLQAGGKDLAIDVVFPVLHGPYGEDGTIQGLLEMINLRYVGSGVLASAVSMDKSFAKPIFAAAGLKVAPGMVVTSNSFTLASNLSYPLFVKPARSGSSRGTTKVKNEIELKNAVAFALEFDTKVLIESAINGREIECAVLQTDGKSIASPVGQIGITQCSYFSQQIYQLALKQRFKQMPSRRLMLQGVKDWHELISFIQMMRKLSLMRSTLCLALHHFRFTQS
jgi:D-alanine-D-alanine ligase